MGFSDNDIRASHTVRIFGTNKQKEVLQDIWLDIERIDIFRISTKSPSGQFQGVYRRLHWMDDPEGADYSEEGNPARAEGTLKICSPDEEDQEDPEEWIPVRTVIEMAWNESTDVNRLGVRRGNRTSADNQVRMVEARRCFHRDTKIDDKVDAATAADSSLKAYVVASDQYDFVDVNDTSKEDKDQFIEVQYVSYTFDQSGRKEDEGKNQGVQFSLKNSHYLTITDKAEGPVNPVHGFDPPWALDPFQAIVNCQFAPLKQVAIGMPNGGFGAPTLTMSTKDGLEFDIEQFGADSFGGSSGLGKTVIGNGYHLVAFGKPKDGPPASPACFIVVDGNWFGGTDNSIRRGVLNNVGVMEWTTIGTFPSYHNAGAFSCGFAGDAFFIQYLAEDANNVHMAVSFDGQIFSYGVNPFVGVDASSVCNPDGAGANQPDPIGGSVAYDKKNKRYVTTGSFTRGYRFKYTIHTAEAGDDIQTSTAFDKNFMSSVSSDGIRWTPKFDLSEGYGTDNFPTHPSTDIANDSGGASTVCFSDKLGLFVAPALYKNNNLNNNANALNPGHIDPNINWPYYVIASSVATSPDGVIWTNKLLGPPSTFNYAAMVQYFSSSYCSTFVKTRDKSGGFFLIGAGGSGPGRANNQVWRSEDGVTWTLTRESAAAFPLAMSQINKKFNPDKVVYV
jgi:hypothetical protein